MDIVARIYQHFRDVLFSLGCDGVWINLHHYQKSQFFASVSVREDSRVLSIYHCDDFPICGKGPMEYVLFVPFLCVWELHSRSRIQTEEMGGILVLFVVALCFWQTAYTPWRTGAFAWKDDYWAILIYAYRFALGVVGVFVMSRAFELIREHLTGTPFIVRTITECGTETLALYILQSIIIERILRSACDIAWMHYPVVLPQSVVNLVGYVIAPVLSFVSIVGLLYVIRYIKRTYILKYAFGFRIK